MFRKPHIDALLADLKAQWGDKPEYQELLRDAHLAIAYSDAGRSLGDELDARVSALIETHRPKG